MTQTQRPRRAGIIGPGGIGAVHIESVRRIGADVTAVAASSADSARRAADRLRVPVACRDYEELIGSPEVDVVHVCTPNSLHAEQVRAAIASGKHVVCEKPLATSAEDADELVELIGSSDRVGAVTYNYRYYPLVQELRAAVAADELGRVHLAHGAYLLEEVFLIDDPDHWMLDPKRVGPALALTDVGVHWWDLVEHVTRAKIKEVVCTRATVRAPDAEGEDSAALIMRLDDGAIATAAISNAAPGHGNTIDVEFIGTSASGAWSQEDPDRLWFGRLGQPAELRVRAVDPPGVTMPRTLQTPAGQPQGYLDAFRDLMSSIYDAIDGRDDSPSYPTFEDGARGVRVLEALVESSASRGWVSV